MGVIKASRLLSLRDGGSQGHSSLSPWVIKVIAIGIVLFASVLLSLYLYSTCKPRNRQSSPMFAAPIPMYHVPHAPIAMPDGSRRRWRFFRGTPATQSPATLVRVSTSSEGGTGLVAIHSPPKAHFNFKSKVTAPTAGAQPA